MQSAGLKLHRVRLFAITAPQHTPCETMTSPWTSVSVSAWRSGVYSPGGTRPVIGRSRRRTRRYLICGVCLSRSGDVIAAGLHCVQPGRPGRVSREDLRAAPYSPTSPPKSQPQLSLRRGCGLYWSCRGNSLGGFKGGEHAPAAHGLPSSRSRDAHNISCS